MRVQGDYKKSCRSVAFWQQFEVQRWALKVQVTEGFGCWPWRASEEIHFLTLGSLARDNPAQFAIPTAENRIPNTPKS